MGIIPTHGVIVGFILLRRFGHGLVMDDYLGKIDLFNPHQLLLLLLCEEQIIYNLFHHKSNELHVKFDMQKNLLFLIAMHT